MMSFKFSGGVEVLGFISPTEPTDQYPVIDPLYGIDGFRNVDTLFDLNSIPNLRRRAGMVVGIGGGTQYYKLNPGPWNGTITDWTIFNSGGGGGGSFTGGTVTGDTIFTQGVTATTFSASTYLGLPLDVYITGGTFDKNTEILTLERNDGNNIPITGFTDIYTTGFTFNPSNYDISIKRNDGVTLTQNLSILASDVTITGGTYNPLNGVATFTNNTGGTFDVSGFITGFTDVQVTGYTYQDNTFTIFDSSGNTFPATINVMTGLTINGNLTITGSTTSSTFYGDGSNLTGISRGGAGGKLFYFNISNTQSPYYEFSTSGTTATEQTISASTLPNSTSLIGGFMTPSDVPNITDFPAGILSFYLHTYDGGTNHSFDIYCELYKRTTGGTETLLFTSDPAAVIGNVITMVISDGYFSGATLNTSDRLVVKVYGTNLTNQTRTIYFVSEGNQHYSFALTTIPTFNDTFVTGFTYNNNTLLIKQNNNQPDLPVTINTMTGLTINGNLTVTGNTSLQGLSATTISATKIGTSGNCINDIYVSNIHSCSPLNINPFDEGNVYFGSTSGFTIDLSNNRVGIGTTIPNAKLAISGQTNFSGETRYYSPSPLYYGYLTGIDQGSGYGTYLRLGNSSSGGHIDILSTNRTYLNQSVGFLLGSTNAGLFGLTTNESITINNGNGTGSTKTLIWAGNNANTNIFKIQGDSKVAINKSTALAALDISGDTLVSGNVGIGTTNPQFKLEVSGTSAFRDYTRVYAGGGNLVSSISWLGTDSGIINLYSGGTSTVQLNTNGVSYLNGGNVGIGITIPTEKLDVVGKTKTINLQVTSGATTGYVLTSDSSGNATWQSVPTFTGGTVNGLTATTISASTYQNLPTDIRVTGGTYSNGTATFTNNTGGTFNVTGFFTGSTDIRTTGATYSNNTFTFTNNTGGTYSVLFNTVTGLTVNGNLTVTGNTSLQSFSGTSAVISGTGQNILTIIGSGNSTTSPIFTVQGSQGELFSISDSLTGSLFSVNDISGLPILEVFSDNTTLMGSYLAPSLNTTARVLATTGTTNVYSIPTSAYTGAFFDYTVSDGTNLRAGNIMSIWSGTSVNMTETQTTDFGNTSGLTFNMVVSSGNAILRTSGTTGNWTIKTIVRSI